MSIGTFRENEEAGRDGLIGDELFLFSRESLPKSVILRIRLGESHDKHISEVKREASKFSAELDVFRESLVVFNG